MVDHPRSTQIKTIRVSLETWRKLTLLKAQYHFRSVEDVIKYLMRLALTDIDLLLREYEAVTDGE